MINEALCRRRATADGDTVETIPGRTGYVLYGPYAAVGPGDYVAQFALRPAETREGSRLCGWAEVVAGQGSTRFARALVFTSQIAQTHKFELAFRVDRRVEDLEMRVYVNGTWTIFVTDACKFRPARSKSDGCQPAPIACPLMTDNPGDVANLYADGFGVLGSGDGLIVEHSGVNVNARIFDDIRFLGEIFLNRIYALTPPGPSVLIDVGMNLGVTSLLLAQEPKFEEIHAFEPFKATYTRAVANLARNPEASRRITPYNFGLSDREETLIGFFNPEDSGMSTTESAGDGALRATATIKDAGAVLAPIFARAEAAGRRIVMKVDCEGSEFPVFRSLERAGLLGKVTAMMVEWHRDFGDRDRELFAPLLKHGFVVIDRDPPEGNGFFYAVRAA